MRINRLLRSATLALTALGIAAPAAAELTRVNDNGFISRHEVVVEASPTAVWLALTTPAGWWSNEHTWSGDSKNLTLTPQAGGCFCETIPEVDEPGRFTLQGSVEHMRVIQAYPELALRMQGALGPLQSEPVTGILTIAISGVGRGTRIVWEYNVGGPMRYEVAVISKAVDGVMGVQVAALGKLLGLVELPQQATPEAVEQDTSGARDAGALKAPSSAPTIRPAPTITAEPVLQPAPKPAPKPSSVDDAFGDLEDDTPGH